MKIGLLSYHKNYNYGWNLQCYALMTVLKSMGHDVILIDKRKFYRQNILQRSKNLLKDILTTLRIRKKHKTYEEIQEQKGCNIAPFFEKYIEPKTHIIHNNKDYKKLPHFDTFIVGSDQVWRSKLVAPITDYYFSFVDYPAKFISYAASFGVDYKEYSKKEAMLCGKLIERFTAVSVRETSGINVINNIYRWNCHPVVMPDPTLLLTSKDYEKIIQEVKDKNIELFCYILDLTNDKYKAINIISENLGLKPYYIKMNENNENPSVEEWLHNIKNAKFIFTDSFHGCVFSLIFRKPFLAYANINRGLARFTSLLETFNQQKRLVNSSAYIQENLLSNLRTIDYEQINNIQDNLRKEAFRFLSQNLNSNNV